MMGVWQADMSGFSGKSKSARIVAEHPAARDPAIAKCLPEARRASSIFYN
jgi:hypothetical protein